LAREKQAHPSDDDPDTEVDDRKRLPLHGEWPAQRPWSQRAVFNERTSAAEATARLAQVGSNALPERRPDPLWRRFARQFNSPLIFILLFALAFDFGLWVYEGAHGWPIEASAIALILLFNAALGLYQEQRSEAALTRLKALAGALRLPRSSGSTY
jgi:magnesium-transporting ATPase (P-type)